MIPSSLLFTPRSDRLSIVFIFVPSLKPLELRPPVWYATILDTICPVARPRILYAKWAPGKEVFLACPFFEMCPDVRCDATTRAENVKTGKGANFK
jgi:hypothetical protein